MSLAKQSLEFRQEVVERIFSRIDAQGSKADWLQAIEALDLATIKTGIEASNGPTTLPDFLTACVGEPEIPESAPEFQQATGMERDQKWLDDYNKLCRSRWGEYPGEIV